MDISALGHCKQLEVLDLSGTTSISTLNIYDNASLEDLDLYSVTSLSTMNIYDNASLQSVDCTSLPTVGTFNLYSNSDLNTFLAPDLACATSGYDLRDNDFPEDDRYDLIVKLSDCE